MLNVHGFFTPVAFYFALDAQKSKVEIFRRKDNELLRLL